MEIRSFQKNEVIFRQGEFQNWMYDVTGGSVGIYADYGEENEKLLTVLQAGQTFGEMGMMDYFPRSATAVVQEDETTVVKVTEEEFSRYFADQPDKLVAIMQQMSRRIRELTEEYLEACKALAETVESENNESKKNSLKEKLQKFMEDYAKACYAAGKYGYGWHYYGQL